LTPESAARLEALAESLKTVEPFFAEALEARAKYWAEQQGLTMKDFAQAARVALSGRSASPPLFEVMAVLGRERTVARLLRAAELAKS
jgi:glutamyl-tRNA synthetase